MRALGREETSAADFGPTQRTRSSNEARGGRLGLSRLVLAMTLAVLLSVASVSTALAGLVTPHRIDDRFSGQAIDSTVWWFHSSQPDQVTLAEGSGQITVNVSAGATNDFDAGLVAQCRASGDFDARLSFALTAWPALDGVGVNLAAEDTGGFNVYRASASGGDSYGAFLPPAGATVPATGSSGTLRLVREGSTMSAYYLSDHHWVAIASGPGPTADVHIGMGVFNISAATAFGRQQATVEFNEFHLFADAIACG